MTRILVAATIAALACLSAGTAGAARDICPGTAVVECVRPLGHNFEICGRLLDDKTLQPATFGLCADHKSNNCAPCEFRTAAETAAVCVARYGLECSYYRLVHPDR